MQDEGVFIGLDVAQAELVVAGMPGTTVVESVRNNVRSISAWLKRLPPGTKVAMESTGRYHELAARLAEAAGMGVYVLNAQDVYHYAKSLGVRGKTDKSDAQVVRRYLVEHHDRLHPWKRCSAMQEELQQLMRRRATIVQHRVALDSTLEEMRGMSSQAAALKRQFDKLLNAIDERVSKIIEADSVMSQGRKNLLTIVGIGPVGSALLASLFGRLKFENINSVIAYSGLDPRPDDSGKRRGRRRISKRGPPALRHQLFMAAFAGCRSKVFKPTYEALRARSLSSTEATIIIARKILRIAWAVWRTGTPFDAARI